MTNTFRQDDYTHATVGHLMQSNGFDNGLGRRGQNNALMYSKGGLYARAVDMPADAAVSQGVKIKGVDDEDPLYDEYDRLNVMGVLADALRWSRLSGGGAIVIVGDDGLINTPFNANALQRIDRIEAYDSDALNPSSERYNDPNQSNFGKPLYYTVHTGYAQFKVHESRIIFVTGEPLPTGVTRAMPWVGRSAVGSAYTLITDYIACVRLIRQLFERKQQPVYKMKGLADAITQKLETIVQKRIGNVDTTRGILNTVAIDAEDEYTVNDLALAGITEALSEVQIAISAMVGIAVAILFGRSPAGMNATGDADFNAWYELVDRLRRTRATPALERITAAIFAQQQFTKVPDSWRISWPALKTLTDKERAELEKAEAERIKTIVEAVNAAMGEGGILEQGEARAYLQSLNMFGISDKKSTAGKAKAYAQT